MAIIKVVKEDGTQEWRQNGDLHRENDLPAVIRTDGSQFWYHYGTELREKEVRDLLLQEGKMRQCQRV